MLKHGLLIYLKSLLLGGFFMDYKNMENSDLASVMVNYIGRTEYLMKIISMYLDGNRDITEDRIRREYSFLKNEIRKDAHYLELGKNAHGSDLYLGFFIPSIKEAAAWGFTIPVDGKVNQDMYNAVSEANYKLQKYKSLEEWRECK